MQISPKLRNSMMKKSPMRISDNYMGAAAKVSGKDGGVGGSKGSRNNHGKGVGASIGSNDSGVQFSK